MYYPNIGICSWNNATIGVFSFGITYTGDCLERLGDVTLKLKVNRDEKYLFDRFRL
jgi:hypothetical protein